MSRDHVRKYVASPCETAPVPIVGGESDETYGVFAGLGYNFNEDYSFVAGYRYMVIDYKKDDFLFDVAISGPMIGLVIRF